MAQSDSEGTLAVFERACATENLSIISLLLITRLKSYDFLSDHEIDILPKLLVDKIGNFILRLVFLFGFRWRRNSLLFSILPLDLHFGAAKLDARSLAVAAGESSNRCLSVRLLVFSFVVFAQRSNQSRIGEIVAVQILSARLERRDRFTATHLLQAKLIVLVVDVRSRVPPSLAILSRTRHGAPGAAKCSLTGSPAIDHLLIFKAGVSGHFVDQLGSLIDFFCLGNWHFVQVKFGQLRQRLDHFSVILKI